MAVNRHRVARRTAEQLVDGRAERLALDVPQRHVDRGNRRHRHRPAAPVGTLVEQLPDVLDAPRIAPHEQRQHVIREVTRDRELAAVQRGVAKADQAVDRLEPQRDEIAPGTADDDAAVGERHRATTSSVAGSWVRELVPAITSNRPGSTMRCMRRSINESSAGPSVKVTVFVSPGANVTRENPRSSWIGRVTELTTSRM